MRFFVKHFKWIMLVSGILTCTMLTGLFAPQYLVQSNFGESIEAGAIDIIVRNWSALIGLMGIMLIAGALDRSIRRSCGISCFIANAICKCYQIAIFEINIMHFFFKLLPPRPDFHLTMDEKESAVMKEHVTYWTALFENRRVIVFGPVFDPSGVYGMAVIETDDEVQAQLIKDNDPAIASGLCTGNLFQMRVGLTK